MIEIDTTIADQHIRNVETSFRFSQKQLRHNIRISARRTVELLVARQGSGLKLIGDTWTALDESECGISSCYCYVDPLRKMARKKLEVMK